MAVEAKKEATLITEGKGRKSVLKHPTNAIAKSKTSPSSGAAFSVSAIDHCRSECQLDNEGCSREYKFIIALPLAFHCWGCTIAGLRGDKRGKKELSVM